MSRPHENQDPTEEIFLKDVVFDVVSVMFHAKRQKLQDKTEKLNDTCIHSIRTATSGVGQKRG